MPTELEKIKSLVMKKIHDGEVKMKPKSLFLIGSVLTFFGLVSSVVTSVFLIGLIRFSLRTHGPMGSFRFNELTTNFPWWTAILALIFLTIGIFLIRKYDFSYKVKFLHIVLGFILTIILAGWLMDLTGINDTLSKRGPMKGIMRGYLRNSSLQINK